METIELNAAMASILKDNAAPAGYLGLNGSDITKSTPAQLASVAGELVSPYASGIMLSSESKKNVYSLFTASALAGAYEPITLIYRESYVGDTSLTYLSVINRKDSSSSDPVLYAYAKLMAGTLRSVLYYGKGSNDDVIVYLEMETWSRVTIPLLFNKTNGITLSMKKVEIDVSTLTPITIVN